jgi:signal transduction histidine kinase
VSRGLTLRTILASALLALAIGSAFTVLLVAVVDQSEARSQALHSRSQLSSSDTLLTLLSDLETGQRGFVITREERFLEPWRAARSALPEKARALARAASDPAQASRARAIERAAMSYIRDYSVPLVNAARRGDAWARSAAATEEGMQRVDSLRVRFDRFRASERDLVTALQDRIGRDSRRAVGGAAAGLAGSILLILLFGGYLARAIVRPLRRAAAMAGRLAEGDLAVRMPETGPAEVGQLERGFNAMASSLEAGHAELTASRARVVAAADQSRRRIERDLHDGAQQRLVSLALELREAEARVPPNQYELRSRLAETAEGVTAVLEDLQEISRGIHPAILSEGGLGPALKTLARRSTIPVRLDIDSGRRLPEHVEVAAYFVTSEALANAAKHSEASVVHVNFEANGGIARLAIRDDGVGGAEAGPGSGLIGLTDRVEALGGTILIVSPPGSGTSILVELPLEGISPPRGGREPRAPRAPLSIGSRELGSPLRGR